jgi:hypothetical protein
MNGNDFRIEMNTLVNTGHKVSFGTSERGLMWAEIVRPDGLIFRDDPVVPAAGRSYSDVYAVLKRVIREMGRYKG